MGDNVLNHFDIDESLEDFAGPCKESVRTLVRCVRRVFRVLKFRDNRCEIPRGWKARVSEAIVK